MAKISPALIGKAGETLVAAELLRQGVEVAYPASDVGVDLLAYQLQRNTATAAHFVPIQIKARSASGYYFFKSWFERAPGVVLVHVWFVTSMPEFYIFRDLIDVEAALGDHARSPSWVAHGGYNVTKPSAHHLSLMQPHRNQWERITNRVSPLRPDRNTPGPSLKG